MSRWRLGSCVMDCMAYCVNDCEKDGGVLDEIACAGECFEKCKELCNKIEKNNEVR